MAGGFDLSDGVSLAEGEAVAMVFNPDLRIARLEAGVAQASAENAGLWEDPELGVDVARILESVDEPWKVFTMLDFTIPVSGRLDLEKKQAGKELGAKLARVAEAEWVTRIALRKAWIEWSSLLEEVETARGFLSAADQTGQIVDRLEEVGELSRIEGRLFRVEQAQRRAELSAIEGALEEAELSVRAIMGLAPSAPLELQPWGSGTWESGTADAWMARASMSNLKLAAAREDYEVAEATLELEVRRQYPDVRIGPGYGREDGMDQFLLGVSLPLPFVNGNRQAIAAAEAQREVARAMFETAYERLASEVSRAETAIRTAESHRRIVEQEVAPLVDAQYADTRRLAELGEINSFILLESLTQQLSAKRQFIDARKAEALAHVTMQELVGPEEAARGAGTGTSAAEQEVTP